MNPAIVAHNERRFLVGWVRDPTKRLLPTQEVAQIRSLSGLTTVDSSPLGNMRKMVGLASPDELAKCRQNNPREKGKPLLSKSTKSKTISPNGCVV